MYSRYAQHLEDTEKSAGTIEQRVGDIQRFSNWFGDPLTATLDDLLAYRRTALEKRAKTYVRRIYSSFRSFYAWAYRNKLVFLNPSLELPRVSVKPGKPKPVPEETLEKAYLEGNEVERAIVLLAGVEGLRRSEIVSLHPRMREGNAVRILGKGERERLVPLDPDVRDALEYLEHVQGTNEYYFPGRTPGRHLHPSTIYKWIKRLSGWNIHAYRHRAATKGYGSTKDLRATQEFLGHSSPATTQNYVEVYFDDIAKVVEGAALPSLSTRRRIAGNFDREAKRVMTIDLDHITQEQFWAVVEAHHKNVLKTA